MRQKPTMGSVLRLIVWGRGQRFSCTAMSTSLLRAVFQQAFQLVHEFLYVLEVEIDGGEADVGDFVELLEMIHQQAANFRGGAFAVGGLADVGLGFVNDRF